MIGSRGPTPLERGRWIARLLHRSWDVGAEAAPVSPEELTAIAPAILSTGCAGLAWRALERTPLRDSPAALEFRAAYRMEVLQAAVREREIVEVLQRLRDRSVEPLLVKGWSIARLYPGKGLRPYGDIDLYALASRAMHEAAIRDVVATSFRVEVHQKHNFPFDRTVDALFEHSEWATLGETPVRLSSPEDHLRLVCLHLLYHGAWRPLCGLKYSNGSRHSRQR